MSSSQKIEEACKRLVDLEARYRKYKMWRYEPRLKTPPMTNSELEELANLRKRYQGGLADSF